MSDALSLRNGSPVRWWRRRALTSILALAVLVPACANQQRQGFPLTDQPWPGRSTTLEPGVVLVDAQRHLDAFCAANDIPGVTLGLVLDDGRAYALASGISNKSDGRAMQPLDRMFSGSIGKTYVAATLLKLAEEGKVELDTPISHWFGDEPWFERLPNARDITLRMLLNHTAGLPRHIMTEGMKTAVMADPMRVWQPEELLEFILDAEPLFPAGQGWSYADTNYILVGMIIERVTGRTYYEELGERILRSLGLTDTSPADRPELTDLISGYTVEDNLFGLPPEVATNGRYAINPQLEWTGGGLIGTARDFARWAWLLYDGHVLEDATLEQMLDAVPATDKTDPEYGLGVGVRRTPHGRVYGHRGWVPGYVSIMAYYPEHQIALAAQVNTDVGMSSKLLVDLLNDIMADIRQQASPAPVGASTK